MTKQQVFDKVVAHLLAQGGRAMGDDGYDCAYRTESGLMCAVGCLIPDELYSSATEGQLVGAVLASSPELQKLFNTDVLSSDLLWDLQSCHDSESVAEWSAGLRRIAIQHDLTLPEELRV